MDYTTPSQLRNQIEEFQDTLNKLSPYDIIKITLNASAAAYYEAPSKAEPIDIQNARINKLREILGELFPAADIKSDMMTGKSFPEALGLVLKFVANLAMKGQSDIYFQPLTSFSYADGQQMLTVTGIILEHNETLIFLNKTNIDLWELSNINWNKPRRIDVPDLTIKERLCIDALLPNTEAKEIQNYLNFLFDKNENRSLEMLKMYVLFYRQSPYFSRIII